MPKSIIQVKVQDSAKERERKINDLARLFDDRIKVLEEENAKLRAEIEELNSGDVLSQLTKIKNVVLGSKFKRAYEDIQASVSLARLPAVNAPTWRTYNYGIGGGLSYPALGFALNDYSEFFIQSSHTMQLRTTLNNHIHWTIPTDSAGDRINFQLDVIGAPPLEDYAVTVGSPYTSGDYILTGVESGRHNILGIADIEAINTGVSTMYVCRLTRIAASANDYAEEVYVTFTDSHYLRDANGSRQEYIK